MVPAEERGPSQGLPGAPPGVPSVPRETGGDAQPEVDALMALVQQATTDAMGPAMQAATPDGLAAQMAQALRQAQAGGLASPGAPADAAMGGDAYPESAPSVLGASVPGASGSPQAGRAPASGGLHPALERDTAAERSRLAGGPPESPLPPPKEEQAPGSTAADAPSTASAAGTQALSAAQAAPQAASGQPQTFPGLAEMTEGCAQYCEADLRPFLGTLAPPLTVPRSPTPADDPRHAMPGMPSMAAAAPAERPPETFDVELVRKDFPVLQQRVHGKPLVWLDNAATSQKPRQVIDAVSRFYAQDNSNIHRGAHTLAARATDAFENSRRKVQAFLGAAETREIVFTRGCTEAINLVAQTWGRKFLQPGDEIVLTTLEHHSNIVPWQMLAQEKGAVLKAVPLNSRGEVSMAEYGRLLGPRTRIVAFSHVSNALGTVVPAREMIELAHRYGAVTVVDGAQSVPHLSVDVQSLDADFYVFSGHKVFAPTGIGVLYGKAHHLEAMPPWQGGGNMIKNVTFEETTYNDLPDKFEAGTAPIAQAVGLGAAIDYLNQIGMENAAQYERHVLDYGTRELSRIRGLQLIGTAAEKVSVLSFVLEGMRAEDLGRYLDREGIAVRAGHHCAQPAMQHFGLTSTVRPSLAFYNTTGDVDALVEAIHKAKKEFSMEHFGGEKMPS